MSSKLSLLIFTLFLFFDGYAQDFTISGYIKDMNSGEELIGANIINNQKKEVGTISNLYGFYSLTLPKDSLTLIFSYVGYEPQLVELDLRKDITLNIKLQPALQLETVEVVSGRTGNIKETSQMSQIEVPIDQIRKIPTLLGESDVLKAMQLLPGVQSGGEGQTGLYVRGGSPDQNLVLLDGVPVYNLSHLLGFYSVFNSDALKNVTLTKGGIPARYGGRLSSVLDISMKEGNMQKFQAKGDIGMISSKLTLEGPIQKDKSSFIISGRRTYIDLLIKPLIKNSTKESGEDIAIALYFYDLNAKLNYKINNKHRLYLSAYTGSDVFGFDVQKKFDLTSFSRFNSQIDWGNITTAFRWNYMINNKLFANTTVTHSRFRFNLGAENQSQINGQQNSFSNQYFSGIYDWGGKIDIDYIPNPNHYLRFGGSLTRHTYEPGILQFKITSDATSTVESTLGSGSLNSIESHFYVEDDFKFGAFKTNIGLHTNTFTVRGKTYASLQPRLSLRYLVDDKWSVKASYTKMAQYINLLTNESLGLPTDLWVPSTDRIKPQDAWQTAIGASTTLTKGIELSIEGYYKKMNNVVSYKEGTTFIGAENNWEDKITQGKGKAYGAEIFLQKKQGKTTGWVGYTLSWNWRQFDEINGGATFPFRYDRRHDISLVLNHQINKRLSISGVWVYGTGNAITLPQYRYTTATLDRGSDLIFLEIENIETKNSFRMPAYHRMDINVELASKKNVNRRWKGYWAFGIYNLYNRKNPYYISTERKVNGERTFQQTSLLGLTPSMVYRFEF